MTNIINSTLNRYSLNISSCPYPVDVESFEGLEQMSELYHYTIRFTSPHSDLTAEMMLNKTVTLGMGVGDIFNSFVGKVVHGVVTNFRCLSGSRDQVTYAIIIEPFLALLNKQFRTHRFFVNQSVPDVVAQILIRPGSRKPTAWRWDEDYGIVLEFGEQ